MLLFTSIVMLFIIFLIKVRNILFRHAVIERKRSSEEIFSSLEASKIYYRSHYEKQKFEKFIVKSSDEFNLVAYYLGFHTLSKGVIILLHGYSVDHHRSCQYIEFFKSCGFNILLVDQRSHGESEGQYTTYGEYEALDLECWVSLIKEKFGEDTIIGIHGHSMGAATALLYSIKGEGKVKFIISESAYSDVKKLLKNKLHNLKVPIFPFYKLTASKIRSKCGFDIGKVSPIGIVRNSSIPILFIHGDRDELVPYSMGMEMYNVKTGIKEIYIVKNGMHNTCYSENRNKYEQVVSKFIKSNILI